ncbi:MAG: GNAT family N-acetyltransferase, partial [Candidatus Aenigmarchaeota archaeon]|nr:GNAT family N-acetyltransferase [Candidatus Aenigmarchaeota archaeon]
MIIRKARLKDIPEIIKLADALVNSIELEKWTTDLEYLKQEKKKSNYLEDFATFYSKKIYSKNALVLVAEEKGKIIGYSNSHIVKEVPIYVIDKTGYMGDVYITPNNRGKNISTKFKNYT